jgi:hypothetical protein
MKTATSSTLLSLLLLVSAHGDPLKSAKITQAVNEVQLFPDGASVRSATVGDTVSGSTSIQTGRRSRAELTFSDNTVTRLGQNSVFSFRAGGRDMELSQGSILLQVPKSNGGATIRTATVTAAITGTTVMFEYSAGKWIKLITLEGTQKLFINGRKDPVLVPAGQMIIMHPDGQVVPNPVTIDLARLLATSTLGGKGLFGPLSPKAEALIQESIDHQKDEKNNGNLIPTFAVIAGPGSRSGQSTILGLSLARSRRNPERNGTDPFPNGP